MGRTYSQILIVLAFILLCSCEKTPNSPGDTPPDNVQGDRYLYVACEGSFGNGNASLFLQNLATNTSFENVYKNTSGNLLGDVFQSVTKINERFFLCVNNSDKVVVLSENNREELGVIDIPKPRYVLDVGNNKAYVSTLYSNKVYIINTESLTVTGTIDMPYQNPEGMTFFNGKAYVCNWDTACNKVFTLDIASDKISDSVVISGYAPHSILVDGSNTIWVLSGNVTKKKVAALTHLSSSGKVQQSFVFNDKEDPIKMAKNSQGDELYYIGVNYAGGAEYNGIFSMSTSSKELPKNPLIGTSGIQYYWGLGVDPVTNDIYVGDPKGFTQKGTVLVYGKNGVKKHSFDVGVGPGFFYFDN